MIRNDLHVHSVQSLCGLHTVLELVQIGARKGMRLIAITDHGSSSGKKQNLGVLLDRRRLPDPVVALDGSSLLVLRGIEASLYDRDGSTDIPPRRAAKLDLVNLGFHGGRSLPRDGEEAVNTAALEAALGRYSIDVLTHPCIRPFPLHVETAVDLAVEHGFALELNNTAMRLGKIDLDRQTRMVELAVDRGAGLVECSDAHAYPELGENEAIEAFLAGMGLDGDRLLLNRDDARLEAFLEERRARRAG